MAVIESHALASRVAPRCESGEPESRRKFSLTHGEIMAERKPANIGLCSANYRAQQVPGAVIIIAEGWHPTSGYQEFFEKSKIDVFPPEFTLWHVLPSGMVN